MVRRLYGMAEHAPLLIRPAKALEDPGIRTGTLQATTVQDPRRVFLYFQDKLGGEIGLPRTPASPELSFDITIIELLPADPAPALDGNLPEPAVRVGKYGVIEVQTTDTHGTYKHAVNALTNALDLHGGQFHRMLAENPEWAGRGIEGPNISNVFKRTFYQIAFKFQVTRRDTSTGCVLAEPPLTSPRPRPSSTEQELTPSCQPSSGDSPPTSQASPLCRERPQVPLIGLGHTSSEHPDDLGPKPRSLAY